MTFGVATPLPAPPTGWFDYAYAVLCGGRLALVRTDRDYHSEASLWRDRWEAGDLHAPRPSPGERLRLSKFDGEVEVGVIETPARGANKVACLADGRWLVVFGRAAPDVNNARLYDADGSAAGAFALGDGVSHVRSAPDGTIWVGYFDEGVFSGHPSNSGVARFGPDGRFLWGLNDAARGDLFVTDCYALTMEGNMIWCCPYTDFPLVRIEEGRIDQWSNEVAGAEALAVDGDYALLAGGYKDMSGRIALVRLDDGRAHSMGDWRFQPPGQNSAQLLQGQGATIHVVGDGLWTRISVAAVRSLVKNSGSG